MSRREFLVGASSLAAVPLMIRAVGCGGDDNPQAPAATGFDFASSIGSGHSHTARITCTQVNGTVDIAITSAASSGHTHTISLSAAELTTIRSGTTVTKTTTDMGHVHTWAISKPPGVC